MSLSIRNNQLSQYAANALNTSTQGLNDSLQRISTGRRINKAADDASGMTIADRLGSSARSMGQQIRNANDEISMVQIADGTLGEATGIIQEIRTKALQAASDAQTTETRTALQADVAAALKSLGDMYGSTTYNGQQLLGTNPGLSELADINLLTAEGAQAGVEAADRALDQIQAARSEFGSRQNQLTSEINNFATQQINYLGAESQIRDVDLAEEIMNMNQMEALRKAGLFALKQSNISAKNIQTLLTT